MTDINHSENLYRISMKQNRLVYLLEQKMSIFNDDGVSLNLNTVLILFLTPNILLILLTALCTYATYVSKSCPRLLAFLSTAVNCFSRGALVSIVTSILQQLEAEKHHEVDPSATIILSSRPSIKRKSSLPTNVSPKLTLSKLTFEKKQDADYLLLIPIQIDLLLTVFLYKILTRRIFHETCRTYLTTYHNRPKHIVCWHKYINNNISNSDVNATLYEYCVNQTLSYINYEYNDVNCIQYAFKLINIIDTITNVLAWHQAITFIITKSILCAYWWQRKMRKTSFWLCLVRYQRRILLAVIIYPMMTLYILIFIFLIPAYFVVKERRRIDLTHYLLYACFKFTVATIAHVNLYTLSKWDSLYRRKDLVLTEDEEQEVGHQQHLRFPTHRDHTTRLSASKSMKLKHNPLGTTISDPGDI